MRKRNADCVVSSSSVEVFRPLDSRPVGAIRVRPAALTVKFNAIVPATRHQLPAHERIRGIPSGVQQIRLACSSIGTQKSLPHFRCAGRLDPDLGRSCLALAFAPTQVRAVLPQVASFGGDLLPKELHCFVQGCIDFFPRWGRLHGSHP